MAGIDKPIQQRDEYGKFIKITSTTPSLVNKSSFNSDLPSLVDLRVTNPIAYLKILLDKIFKNSEISFTVRIKPMALISVAIAIAIILGGSSVSFFYLIKKIFSGF